MCDNNVGVAKRIELDSKSKDVADLVKLLEDKVEGPVKVSHLKTIETKIQKILKS
jgi:hypothetical protein